MGREHKGPRDAIMTRPHADVGRILRARADEGGYTLGDYAALCIAEHVGRPDLAPKPSRPPKRPQVEELPLTG